eukprot:322978-Pelagomonas_calceolata.AAC.1
MGELIKGHDMSGPDFAAEQGCGFLSVNNMGKVPSKACTYCVGTSALRAVPQASAWSAVASS